MQGAVGLIPGWGAMNTCLVAKKNQNRSNIVTNLIKILNLVHIKKIKRKKKAQPSGEF